MSPSQLAALRQAVGLFLESNLAKADPEYTMVSAAFSALLSRLSRPGYTPTPGEVGNCSLALRVYISLRPETSGQQRALLDWLSQNYGA